MLIKRRERTMGRRWLVGMILACMVLGFSGSVFAEWYPAPSYLDPSEESIFLEDEELDARDDRFAQPGFYMPDLYQTHRLTGYSAVALTLLSLVTGDDKSFHKVSGVGAAVFGVAAGASGHIAYGEGINFREGWTRENIHAGSGYLATAALVLTGVLGAADENHSAAGGVAAAAVVVPVAVFVF
ncbi:hypothetical protein [Desulfoluna sp.]|uniref:hypothetical protein n=1 Tax=Desulfoluna sp. TaxID=2045199 RepID=UPI00263571A3|nr:hypothetical protein [Desulfoluna sp.]